MGQLRQHRSRARCHGGWIRVRMVVESNATGATTHRRIATMTSHDPRIHSCGHFGPSQSLDRAHASWRKSDQASAALHYEAKRFSRLQLYSSFFDFHREPLQQAACAARQARREARKRCFEGHFCASPCVLQTVLLLLCLFLLLPLESIRRVVGNDLITI